MGTHVSISSVQYMRDAYKRQKDVKSENGASTSILALPRQAYLKKVREGVGVITARVAVAAARGIIMACNRSSLGVTLT